MTSNIELGIVEDFDLSTNGYIDTDGLIITDEIRGWVYRFEHGWGQWSDYRHCFCV